MASISSDNPALVTCVDDERLEFQVGKAGEIEDWGSCSRLWNILSTKAPAGQQQEGWGRGRVS